MDQGRRARTLARELHQPHGAERRPDGGDGQRGPGARGARAAGCGCVAVPGGAVREHERADADAGGEDRRGYGGVKRQTVRYGWTSTLENCICASLEARCMII